MLIGKDILITLYKLWSNEVITSVLMASSGVMPPLITNGPAVEMPTIMLGNPEIMTKQDDDGKPNICVKGLASFDSQPKMPVFISQIIINRVGITIFKIRLKGARVSVIDALRRLVQLKYL